MALKRLFIPAELKSGRRLRVDSEQARYLGRVLRLRSGDALTVFNGNNGEFSASIVGVGKDTATLLVESHIETATESPLRIHLVQGISRGEKMDFVVQKATELGVKRITPVFTEYGVVKLDARRAAKRRDHWQGVAASACEQCGRIRPPLIDEPISLNSWFGEKTGDSDIDLILQPRAATALTSITSPRSKVCMLIGPEGGFSSKECDDATAVGFKAVSLGPRILRTETAATSALAVAQCLWGDFRHNRTSDGD